MNQAYFEWYKFDINVDRILIATCTYVTVSTDGVCKQHYAK